MEITGVQQTCYSDWGRVLTETYPFKLTFKKDSDIVRVYVESTEVGHFNFGDGTGYIDDDQRGIIGQPMEKTANFDKFDLESMLT